MHSALPYIIVPYSTRCLHSHFILPYFLSFLLYCTYHFFFYFPSIPSFYCIPSFLPSFCSFFFGFFLIVPALPILSCAPSFLSFIPSIRSYLRFLPAISFFYSFLLVFFCSVLSCPLLSLSITSFRSFLLGFFLSFHPLYSFTPLLLSVAFIIPFFHSISSFFLLLLTSILSFCSYFCSFLLFLFFYFHSLLPFLLHALCSFFIFPFLLWAPLLVLVRSSLQCLYLPFVHELLSFLRFLFSVRSLNSFLGDVFAIACMPSWNLQY